MYTHWNYSNYGNDIRITKRDAEACSHSGDCESDVLAVIKKPYIKKQLSQIKERNLIKELREYGAWSDKELQDHDRNLIRWVWISCCDITERLIK